MNNMDNSLRIKSGQKAEMSNIVIIDDVPANLRLLVGILARPDYIIHPILDPVMAINGIKADPPDIILLDIMMPTMSGYDLCYRLKSDPDTIDIPVIFITSRDDIEDKVKGFSMGAVDYITKPFQADDVIVRVQTHIKMYSLQKNLRRKTEEMVSLNKVLEGEIIERQKVEVELRESYLWLNSVFNALEESVIILNPHREIMDVNPAAEKMFGYTRDEMKKQPSEILHIDYKHYIEFKERTSQAFDRGKPLCFEYMAKRKNGTVFPTEYSVALLKTDTQKSIGMINVVRDLTAKKETEERLRESEKLKTVLEIAGAVCHELNQPLMSISGYTELAIMDTEPQSPAHIKLKKIESQVRRMAEITKKLMHVSRYRIKNYPDGKILDIANASDDK